jgi:Fe-S-cluster containining protein
MDSNRDDTPWYADGLAFACTRCGACCTGAPGNVWVTPEEIGRIAERLGLTPDEFGRRYVRQVGARFSLVERPGGDCVFWDRAAGCTIYAARPAQCRTWPFWPAHLAAPEAWRRVQRRCPGAGVGPVHSVEEIEAQARRAAIALGSAVDG